MNSTLLLNLIDYIDSENLLKSKDGLKDPLKVKPVSDKTIAYGERHRGVWSFPEYDFDEIQIAQDADGYISRSINKKVNRVLVAGYEFVGSNEETVSYIKHRINEMSWVSGKPHISLIENTIRDLFRYNNCMWVKARKSESSSGEEREDIQGYRWAPVAAYFICPFETLQFKTKPNGEVKKIMQKLPTGKYKEFFPEDCIHFYTNKKPGFTVGTPEILPALDDVALLRRIEENVEDLIETHLFPVYHYKVGSDAMPERWDPDGIRETDLVKATISYMAPGSFYISDHRHEIVPVGAEGQALRIDTYIAHFKQRVFSSLGTTSLDMGEGDSANRSTANTLSKGTLMDIEAVIRIFEEYFRFYVINELLLEGGYDPFDPENDVKIKFGVIDKDERRADENQQIQLFVNNLRTIDEVRMSLGDKPFTDDMLDRTFYKMFSEPANLLKALAPGSAAGETLAKSPSSNISEEALNKEKAYQEKLAKEQAKTMASGSKARTRTATGRPPSTSKAGASNNKARPANQRGTRAAPKTNRDDLRYINLPDGTVYELPLDISEETIQSFSDAVNERYEKLKDVNISATTIAESLSWRLK